MLRETKATAGPLLCECFDLIFGTSTGSITASLLALGYKVEAIHALFQRHVPTVTLRDYLTRKFGGKPAEVWLPPARSRISDWISRRLGVDVSKIVRATGRVARKPVLLLATTTAGLDVAGEAHVRLGRC
ncbi:MULTISPECIES: patatin-like phospholipase family protein [unclassified Burkholderia]|uniref:patatin-like phospholipase family protein n=1 Tax=unclassified Burkholderia TaxID=2613784 RepID=UPI00211AC7CA|nr:MULTISPECIES: patatin-like phospholipase family protein [unclassified Burkholderia]